MELIPVIGLEMHAEMNSTTKAFSPAQNTYNDISNLHVNKIDVALPGILPIANKECMERAIEMALILKCDIPDYFIFDRKNYRYFRYSFGRRFCFFRPLFIFFFNRL